MREAENNQPSVKVVRYIGTGARHRMDAIKITHLAHVGSQSLVQLLHHLIGVSLDADKRFTIAPFYGLTMATFFKASLFVNKVPSRYDCMLARFHSIERAARLNNE